jgi:hypothetical protein
LKRQGNLLKILLNYDHYCKQIQILICFQVLTAANIKMASGILRRVVSKKFTDVGQKGAPPQTEPSSSHIIQDCSLAKSNVSAILTPLVLELFQHQVKFLSLRSSHIHPRDR